MIDQNIGRANGCPQSSIGSLVAASTDVQRHRRDMPCPLQGVEHPVRPQHVVQWRFMDRHLHSPYSGSVGHACQPTRGPIPSSIDAAGSLVTELDICRESRTQQRSKGKLCIHVQCYDQRSTAGVGCVAARVAATQAVTFALFPAIGQLSAFMRP